MIQEKIKLAFVVVDSRGTSPDPLPWFGSAPTALLQGFEELEDEIEVHVACCTMGDHPRPEKLGRNIWFHSRPVPKWGYLKTLHRGCRRAVREMIGEIQPDVIHAQGTERWCAVSVQSLPQPKLLTIHGFLKMIDPLMKMKPRAYWKAQTFLERFAIPRFDGVVAITEYTRRNLEGLNPRSWIVHNATEGGYFSIARKPVDPPVFLYVGNIQERKNQVGFIDAVAPLAGRFAFRIRVCGAVDPADEYTKSFLERVERFDWVESVGHVSREDLKRELREASGMILVSHEDNCPMVVLEAMSVGMPVLGSRVGGIPELVEDGVTGYLCDPQDPASMREGFRRLIEDPVRAEALGAAGRDKAEKLYRPVAVARRHLEIYREVLAEKSGA